MTSCPSQAAPSCLPAVVLRIPFVPTLAALAATALLLQACARPSAIAR